MVPRRTAVDHMRGVLRVEQHDVGAGRVAQLPNAVAHHRQVRRPSRSPLSIELVPSCQITTSGRSAITSRLEAGEHVVVGVAVDAAVDAR